MQNSKFFNNERNLKYVSVILLLINFYIIFVVPFASYLSGTEFVTVTYQLDNLHAIGKIGMMEHWVGNYMSSGPPHPINAADTFVSNTIRDFAQIFFPILGLQTLWPISVPHFPLVVVGMLSIPIVKRYSKGTPLGGRIFYIYFIAVNLIGMGGSYWIFH